ncbi:MAG: Serine/threonine-protein kinase PknB, partial [Planctomycetota bacterium]
MAEAMPRLTRLPTQGGLAEATDLAGRVRLLLAVAAGAFAVVSLLAVSALAGGAGHQPATGIALLGGLVAAVSALAIPWVRPVLGARRIRLFGQGYVVGVAMAMAATEAVAAGAGGPTWGLSGIGVWCVFAPIILPVPPRTAMVAAVLCAGALPAAWGLARLCGAEPLPWPVLAGWFGPLLFCAGLAAVASASLHRLGQDLGEARRQLRELGRYRLVERIGAGGMGEVWAAEHRLLRRPVAIKLVRPELAADPAHAERLEREAAAISELESPHTVRLFDFGIADSGERYYVMERLHGFDLETAVRRGGALPPWRVARILEQACRSLAEAHAAGLVHRDISPGNLMLCRLGGELDVVKVLDFGLARPASDGAGGGGTPGYQAPEVLLGTRPADARADLYGLGCVAWWLLAGAEVFPGDDPARIAVA